MQVIGGGVVVLRSEGAGFVEGVVEQFARSLSKPDQFSHHAEKKYLAARSATDRSQFRRKLKARAVSF